MRRLHLYSTVLLLGSTACGGVDAPNSETASEESALFALRTIRSETIVLQARGDQADVYAWIPPARLRGLYRDRFPVVVFLQGALVSKEFYSEYARQVARQGFIVVVPNRFQSFPPGTPPAPFPDQIVLTDALAEFERLDADPSSPYFQIVDTARSAVAGHSFGGAIGLFAIDGACNPPLCFGFFQRPASLKAGVFFGTNTFQGGVVTDLDTSAVSTAIIQGTLDGVSTPTEGEQTFDRAIDGTKAFIRIEGVNHFGITDVNLVPGSQPDPNLQTASQDAAIRKIALWSGRALRAFVKDDPFAKFWIFESGGSLDESVTVRSEVE